MSQHSSGTILRHLNAREASYIYGPSHTVFAISVLLPAPLPSLRSSIPPAVDQLAEDYLLLCATIDKVSQPKSRSEFVFVHKDNTEDTAIPLAYQTPTLPSEVSEQLATDTLQHTAEVECDIPFDLTKNLFRIVVLDLVAYTGCVFLFSHTIADGKFGMEVAKTWVESFQKQGTHTSVPNPTSRPTIPALIPSKYGGMFGWLNYMGKLLNLIWWTLWNQPVSPRTRLSSSSSTTEALPQRTIDITAPWYMPRVLSNSATAYIHFTIQETQIVLQRAKNLGVSFTSLFYSVTAEAIRNSETIHPAQNMLAALAADTRPYLDPPVSSRIPGAYNSVIMIRLTPGIAPHSIQTQIAQSLKISYHIHSQRFASSSFDSIPLAILDPSKQPKAFPPMMLTFSNLGVYKWAEDVALKPVAVMFSCAVSVGHGAVFNVHAVTVDGRMFLEIAADEVWVGKERVRGLMEEVKMRLLKDV
ncbi:hypothetical protein HDV00_004336 [Rhizophlyctis rosea]|nr:hypothetical protein HDV00_004336 [Rhizophlyctis rosea]